MLVCCQINLCLSLSGCGAGVALFSRLLLLCYKLRQIVSK
jgi:hypothetical protein